ncbi:GGDEF domain-containing protein [Patulibacter sp. NPDC049589]|uniref:GGDEF domain-containing protein n=1 Tax=Patulibacter sp. NPDC049589 TaxID=3154731 RepID=UPI003433402D
MGRSHRSGGVLVATYLDVVGLKAVNDERGHATGDLLLQRVIATVRERLRPYDLVVRLGGDEFVCVMPGLPLVTAEQRFAGIAMSLAQPPGAAIRTGFAVLAAKDTAATLVGRADDALVRMRRGPGQRTA